LLTSYLNEIWSVTFWSFQDWIKMTPNSSVIHFATVRHDNLFNNLPRPIAAPVGNKKLSWQIKVQQSKQRYLLTSYLVEIWSVTFDLSKCWWNFVNIKWWYSIFKKIFWPNKKLSKYSRRLNIIWNIGRFIKWTIPQRFEQRIDILVSAEKLNLRWRCFIWFLWKLCNFQAIYRELRVQKASK